MAKSREKVNKQLGFWDSEVSTPSHDTICLWAYQNPEIIFRAAHPEMFDHPWQKNEVHLPFQKEDATRDQAKAFADATPRPNPRITTKTIEYVLKNYTGYGDRFERIVGYADLMIETEIPYISAIFKANPNGYGEEVFDQFRIGWSRRADAPWILVEVKSVMPTVGELLRQINLYRTAFKGKCVLVCPDDTFADILAEQNVTFIKYAP